MISLKADKSWFTIDIEGGPKFLVYEFVEREKLNEPYEFRLKALMKKYLFIIFLIFTAPHASAYGEEAEKGEYHYVIGTGFGDGIAFSTHYPASSLKADEGGISFHSQMDTASGIGPAPIIFSVAEISPVPATDWEGKESPDGHYDLLADMALAPNGDIYFKSSPGFNIDKAWQRPYTNAEKGWQGDLVLGDYLYQQSSVKGPYGVCNLYLFLKDENGQYSRAINAQSDVDCRANREAYKDLLRYIESFQYSETRAVTNETLKMADGNTRVTQISGGGSVSFIDPTAGAPKAPIRLFTQTLESPEGVFGGYNTAMRLRGAAQGEPVAYDCRLNISYHIRPEGSGEYLPAGSKRHDVSGQNWAGHVFYDSAYEKTGKRYGAINFYVHVPSPLDVIFTLQFEKMPPSNLPAEKVFADFQVTGDTFDDIKNLAKGIEVTTAGLDRETREVASNSPERSESLKRMLEEHKKQLNPENSDTQIWYFFSFLSSIYKGDMCFSRGAYSHAAFFIYSAANSYFITTVGLVKEADAHLLRILADAQYLADSGRGGCLAPEFFKSSDSANNLDSLRWVLRLYQDAAEFYKIENSESGFSLPPEYLEQLRAKIEGVEKFLTSYSASPPESCLDLAEALTGFDDKPALINNIKSRPDFLPGPCPYFQESEINAWPDEEETTHIDTALGAEYISAYMRDIPIDYMRAPSGPKIPRTPSMVVREIHEGDFEKIKPRFLVASHAWLLGDFYFSKKMYGQAFEQYDIAAKNIPSFINLTHRADARIMLLINGDAPHEQLQKAIEEYEAALAVYKFEKCEGLTRVPLMEMAWTGDKIKCLKKNVSGGLSPDALAACLKDEQPIYQRCIEFVNPNAWPCPGDGI